MFLDNHDSALNFVLFLLLIAIALGLWKLVDVVTWLFRLIF